MVVFHLDPSWLPGGFLGVDVFFVISGFLITTLLVRERRDTGRVDLRGFWTRRARRLLPALLVVVPAAILIARTVEADLLVGVRRRALGALTFSTNWLEIARGSNYFAATSPQLFMNFWSLAVEEQFYLFWPLVMLGLLTLHRRFALTEGALATIVLGVGVASAVLMALTYDGANATRAYYGTDTHLFGLMLGAAPAIVWTGPLRAYTTNPRWGAHRRWFVGGAIATIAALFLLAGEEHARTFVLGIPLVSVATAVLLLAAVERPGKVRAVLELPPLARIGQRSYGIYLWHWPVILIVARDIPTNAGTPGFVWTRVWAVVVTLAVADLSFRFVETPVRRLGFRETGRRILGAFALLRSVRTRRIVLGGVVAGAPVPGVVLVTAPDTTTTQRTIEQNRGAGGRPAQDRARPHLLRHQELHDADRGRDRRLRRLDGRRLGPGPRVLLPRHPDRRPLQPPLERRAGRRGVGRHVPAPGRRPRLRDQRRHRPRDRRGDPRRDRGRPHGRHRQPARRSSLTHRRRQRGAEEDRRQAPQCRSRRLGLGRGRRGPAGRRDPPVARWCAHLRGDHPQGLRRPVHEAHRQGRHAQAAPPPLTGGPVLRLERSADAPGSVGSSWSCGS
uniref:Acyltransferase n=1 Tax=Janibacter limosus TaxID=53458 RepID=A0AC61U6M7_9MICO|nr:acyltransferase [Janibacter limosus]